MSRTQGLSAPLDATPRQQRVDQFARQRRILRIIPVKRLEPINPRHTFLQPAQPSQGALGSPLEVHAGSPCGRKAIGLCRCLSPVCVPANVLSDRAAPYIAMPKVWLEAIQRVNKKGDRVVRNADTTTGPDGRVRGLPRGLATPRSPNNFATFRRNLISPHARPCWMCIRIVSPFNPPARISR